MNFSSSKALASLSLSILLSSLGTSIANVALPTFAETFAASFQQVQWIVLAYLLAVTTLIVSAGRLGDLVGRRRMLLGGIVLFTAASILCGIAPSLRLLIAARAAQGMGAAVMTALTMPFVAEAVPKQKTGSAMGLLGTMSAVGTALGPSLGGMLITGFGWRSIFFINVPLGLLTWLLAWRSLPADHSLPNTNRARFDHAGTLLLTLTLAAYALAMTMGRGRFGVTNIALLLAAIAGAALFALAEAKAPSPLIRFAMFRNPVLSAGFATSSLVTTVVMATLVVGPFYLSGALALDAARVGLVMTCGPIVAALAGVPAGRIVDRFGTHRMIVAALLAMIAGASILAMMPARFGIPGYVAPLVIITAGYALFQAANNTAVMSDLRPDQRGVVSGMLNLSRNLGLITGASVMGAVFALASAATNMTTASPEAVSAGMRATFGVAAVLVVIALAIAIAGSAAASNASRAVTASVAGAFLLVSVAPLQAATTPIPLGGDASLTLSGEARLRYDVRNNAMQQGLFRGILGADLRFNRHVRVFGEIGTGQVAGHRGEAAANFQNDASLQQLFVDAHGSTASTVIGAIAGRQELSEGPRQLISISDGPNLHRTWNGVRVYAHHRKIRVSVFDLRATRLNRGAFDEEIRHGERLRGITASIAMANTHLDPFWIHSSNPSFRSRLDVRDTIGARVWGKRGDVKFDWTAVYQSDAWGVFAVHGVMLSGEGWKPRLTSHVDVASEGFNPLYASSSYLGDGQFLSLSNLLMIAPGIAVSPTRRTNVAIEYGFARRLTEHDAAYAGGMRAYAGTENVEGHAIGGLLRIGGTWAISEHLTWSFNYEHLSAGAVLERAHLRSGSYSSIGATFRY